MTWGVLKACVVSFNFILQHIFQARDLEVAVEDEKRRYADTEKNLRKQERRMKELQFQSDEDHKNQGRMQDMIDKLQGKIKTYKHQVEEAVSRNIFSM